MAKSGAVWGIDIGQCALKALRCRPHESDADRIVVEAFDYVEYPKLLSQPDAEPEELVAEALETFLSRNELKGDRVAISVPGQSGLARFIKLPPVETKKIPDIVKYEARQQIPFALEDVVWDYQPLAGGSQDEGYALETEVGLFAMKRDQVATALEPLTRAGIEIDYIQLAPLALYNYICFDQLTDLNDEEFNPAEPPPSTVLLSIGVDTTDLVITNGYRVWQRNIQIGGSHFTKALTKELKLTFSKAEHVKRNATKAEDPKAVFQAMRPVFSDLVAEIQRSIAFFSSSNRGAELSEVYALGNAMKLPGLQRYLEQNLEAPLKTVDEFRGLVGGSVTATPAFDENRLAFPVAYGLCVQALGSSRLVTNLLPEEIVTSRMIKAKKPWIAAAAAMLLACLGLNYSQHVSALQSVDLEERWGSPISQSKNIATRVSGYSSENSSLVSRFEEIREIGENLQSNIDGRLIWPEVFKAIDACIPHDPRPEGEREQTVEDITAREELHIESLDCEKFEDLSTWFTRVKPLYDDAQRTKDARLAAEKEREAAEAAAAAAAAGEELPAEEAPLEDPALAGGGFPGEESLDGETGGGGPTGEGWVIQLTGHHFHNDGENLEAAEFVRATLIERLINGSITLPDGPAGEMIEVTNEELGIAFPVIITQYPIQEVTYDPEAGAGEQAGGRGSRGGLSGPGLGEGLGALGPGRGASARGVRGDDEEEEDTLLKLRRYDFTVQFVWTPTPRHTRSMNREEAARQTEGLAANE